MAEQQNTADLTPSKSNFDKIKDNTKEMVNKLLGFFKQEKTKDNVTVRTPSNRILKGIHKLLVEQEAQRKENFRADKKRGVQEEQENERRHQEILNVLLGIKPPPEPEVETAEQVPEEKKEVKEGEKPETPKKPKAKPKAKKVAKKPSARKATKKTVKRPKAATAKKVTPKKPRPSAEKVAVGAAVAGTIALVGTEALAENISKYESRGSSGRSFGGNEYNAYNKGTSGNSIIPADEPIDFSKMTIEEYLKRGKLKSGDPKKIFAVGRYQIIPQTMESLVEKLKIDPKTTYLDPLTQDMLFNKGLIATKRPKVAAYINGQSDNRDAAILELAQEFASVGVPYDMTVGGKKLKKGDSYYSGVGGNKAHNPPEQVGAALDADRAKASKVVPATTPPATGEKVDKLSADSKQMKAEEADRSSANKVTNNVTVAQNNQTITQKPKVVDDRSIYERTQHG